MGSTIWPTQTGMRGFTQCATKLGMALASPIQMRIRTTRIKEIAWTTQIIPLLIFCLVRLILLVFAVFTVRYRDDWAAALVGCCRRRLQPPRRLEMSLSIWS